MKEKKNYIDNIPKINDMKWDVSEDGIVEITVENTGFYNTIAQKIFKKPRYSFIKLDEYGSFVWQKIDGKKSIYEDVYKRQALHLIDMKADFCMIRSIEQRHATLRIEQAGMIW